MSETHERWEEVDQSLTSLGRRFREHYETTSASSAEAGGGPAADEVSDAFKTLGRALESAFSSVNAALRDPDVRDDARHAAESFGKAIGATFTDLGKRFNAAAEGEEIDTPPEALGADEEE